MSEKWPASHWWRPAQQPILLKPGAYGPLRMVMPEKAPNKAISGPVQEVLSTPRMLLRPPRLSDARAIFETWGNDPVVTRYLTWAPSRSVVDTEVFLRGAIERMASGEEHSWLMTPRKGPGAMGMVSVWQENQQAELGFVLARPYWNRGYMTEALETVINWCDAREDIQQVWAVCDIDNLASAYVLEKAGLSPQGLVEGWSVHPNLSRQPRDCLAFARIFA